MKKRMNLYFLILSLSFFCQSACLRAACEQINPSQTYSDGIPYCPESVKINAHNVTSCAFKQARKWHAATPSEKSLMNNLITSLKNADAKQIISYTNQLRLQVCRSTNDTNHDSFLLMYTKPGISDYSGPFIMFREGGKTSQIILQAPHDGTDATDLSVKAAFQNSNALAYMSNGHPKDISGRTPNGSANGGSPQSDWAHTTADLGYSTSISFLTKFSQSIFFQIHGSAGLVFLVTDNVFPNGALDDAFIAASTNELGAHSNITVKRWGFNGFIVGESLCKTPNGKGRKNNNRWIGTEIPVRLHLHTDFVTRVVKDIEAGYLRNLPAPSSLLSNEEEADQTEMNNEESNENE